MGSPSGAAAAGRRARLVPGLVVAIAAGTLALGALVPRDLSQGEDAPIWNVESGLLAFDLSRAVTALCLLASALAAARAVLARGFPRAGLGLWLAYLAFVLSNFLLPGLAAREPGLDLRLLLPPIAFTAVYLSPAPEPARLEALAKNALLAFVWASLAGAVLLPSRTLAGGYDGVIPGLDLRLYGLGGGATSLGTLSAAYVTVEVVSPTRSRLRWLNLAAAHLALFLTQSKTSWIFAAAVVGFWEGRRLWRRLPRLAVHREGRMLKGALLACGAGAAVVLVVAWVASLDLASLQGGNLVTLTGRTYIWAQTVATWLESPILGYGLGLWENPSFRARFGPYDHAHNQFLHALASAGVVGLLGFVVYLRRAFQVAGRAASRTPVPMVLLLGLVALCLTNVPLRAYYLLDAFVLLHLLLFAFLVAEEQRHPPAVPAPGADLVPGAALPRAEA